MSPRLRQARSRMSLSVVPYLEHTHSHTQVLRDGCTARNSPFTASPLVDVGFVSPYSTRNVFQQSSPCSSRCHTPLWRRKRLPVRYHRLTTISGHRATEVPPK